MASCARCHAEHDVVGATWCKECEQLFDRWVRRYANDIVWQALVGTAIISAVAVGLPILGVGTLVAAAGAFAGFGALFGLARVTRRRRRQQFLQAPLPRAYLPAPK
jgi:hypothetical protein